jgi:hypothetical protein
VASGVAAGLAGEAGRGAVCASALPANTAKKKNNGVGQLHSISSAFGLTTKLKKQLVSSLMHLNPDSCKRQPPP